MRRGLAFGYLSLLLWITAQFVSTAFNPGAVSPSVTPGFVSGALRGVTVNGSTNTALGTQTFTLNSPCATLTYCIYFPAPTLSGNAIEVDVFYASSPSTTITVKTDQSQTLSSVVTSSAESSKLGQAFVLCNATPARGITVAESTGTIIYDVFVNQWAGVASSSCVDQHASSVGTATTTPSGGSVTPTQSGDIISAHFLRAGTPLCSTNPCYTAGTGQTGITWALRAVDYQNGGGFEWGTYNLTSALSPTITAISSTYIGLTVAYNVNTSDGTNATGMYPIYETACNTPSTSSSTQKCQAPNTGNLVTTQSVGGDPTITSVASSGKTWVVPGGPSFYDNASAATPASSLAYAANASSDGSGQITFTLSSSGAADATLLITDWAGAATMPFVNRQIMGGNDPVTAVSTLTYLPAFYPGITKGWTIGNAGWFNNTSSACLSPSGCNFLNTTWGAQQLNGPSLPDQNNFWAFYSTTSASSQVWEAGFIDSANLNGWAGEASSFLSATGSYSGPSFVQTPSQQSTSGTTTAITFSPTQSGTILAVAAGSQTGTIHVTSVCTDGTTCAAGNTFTQASSATASSIGADAETWYLTGHASGVTTVTVKWSGTITNAEAKGYEIRTATALDSGGTGSLSNGTGSANVQTGASVSPTGSPSILISIVATNAAHGVSFNPYDGNYFGYDNLIFNDGDSAGAAIVASGTYSYTVGNTGATDAFCNATAAFK